MLFFKTQGNKLLRLANFKRDMALKLKEEQLSSFISEFDYCFKFEELNTPWRLH